MNKEISFFLLYSEYYDVDFNSIQTSETTRYCSGSELSCLSCLLRIKCTREFEDYPTLNAKDIAIIKITHPEYFI